VGLIEQFIESEKQKLNWLQKLSANYPEVTATRVLAREHAEAGKRWSGNRQAENRPEAIIRPAVVRRSVYFLLFLVALFSCLLLLSLWRDHRDPLWVFLVFVPFSLFVSVSFLLVNFRSEYNYTIRVSATGMTIRDSFIAWGDILETAIMRQDRPRSVDRFLVIFTRDGTVQKLNLYLFGISDRKLAATVEYYKAQAVR